MTTADPAIRFRASTFPGWALAAVWVGILLVLVGCDDGDATSPISITPHAASLQTGDSMDFVATGGSDYTWSLRYEDTGTLSARSGSQVRFTSTYSGTGATIEQVLMVVGTIADGTSASAEAQITQVAVGGTADNTSSWSTNSSDSTALTMGEYQQNTQDTLDAEGFTAAVDYAESAGAVGTVLVLDDGTPTTVQDIDIHDVDTDTWVVGDGVSTSTTSSILYFYLDSLLRMEVYLGW